MLTGWSSNTFSDQELLLLPSSEIFRQVFLCSALGFDTGSKLMTHNCDLYSVVEWSSPYMQISVHCRSSIHKAILTCPSYLLIAPVWFKVKRLYFSVLKLRFKVEWMKKALMEYCGPEWLTKRLQIKRTGQFKYSTLAGKWKMALVFTLFLIIFVCCCCL